MKLAHTFEVTPEERQVIGAIMTGKIQNATRDQMHDFFGGLARRTLARSVAKLERLQENLAGQIVADAEAIIAEATDE